MTPQPVGHARVFTPGPDGTFSYTRVVPNATFTAGNSVTYRFATQINGQSILYKPGPTQSTSFPAFVDGQPPTTSCP